MHAIARQSWAAAAAATARRRSLDRASFDLPATRPQVTGIDLKQPVAPEVVERIKEDVARCGPSPANPGTAGGAAPAPLACSVLLLRCSLVSSRLGHSRPPALSCVQAPPAGIPGPGPCQRRAPGGDQVGVARWAPVRGRRCGWCCCHAFCHACCFQPSAACSCPPTYPSFTLAHLQAAGSARWRARFTSTPPARIPTSSACQTTASRAARVSVSGAWRAGRFGGWEGVVLSVRHGCCRCLSVAHARLVSKQRPQAWGAPAGTWTARSSPRPSHTPSITYGTALAGGIQVGVRAVAACYLPACRPGKG